MKNIILLLVALGLISCVKGVKNNEEIQYYNFNERQKAAVQIADIYITKVTKPETLSSSITSVKSKDGSKLVGSWDFSQTPSKTLKNEIKNKAVELGANHILLFEQKNCENINMLTYAVQSSDQSYCYRIWYHYVPELDVKPVVIPAVSTQPEGMQPKVEIKKPEATKVHILQTNPNGAK